MILFMRQAETLHETRKYELERLDEERISEDVYIYVFPLGGVNSTDLKVTAKNKGEIVTKIVRLWINDDYYPLNKTLKPMSEIQDLGIYPISPQNGSSYFITVTTDRGRVVGFDTPLTWVDDMIGWDTDILCVNILVTSLPGHIFRIVVNGTTYEEEYNTEKFDPKFFIVPLAGDYTVRIYRGFNLLYTEIVTINWPDGPPVEWVFA